eukprot:5363057-Pleurochrysis_carterae.AAC.1
MRGRSGVEGRAQPRRSLGREQGARPVLHERVRSPHHARRFILGCMPTAGGARGSECARAARLRLRGRRPRHRADCCRSTQRGAALRAGPRGGGGE